MVANWEGSIVSFPMVVVRPKTAEEIAAIIGNTDDYPSPVRAVGSNHSTTHCGVADKGTLIEMSAFQDVRIDKQNMTVTAGAGALYIDVAHKLAQENLQFYVNVELGNLSVGSAACGGTKDASMPGDDEYGQVSSYAIGMKIVEPDCNLGEVSEADGDRLKMMRSSYGLLGIIYEATFRVRAMEPLAVRHKTYRLGEFQDKFNDEILNNKDESMMLYLFPFLNRITVEFRRYDRDGAVGKIDTFLWTLRNWVLKLFAPAFGHYVTKFVPIKFLRYLMIDWFNRLIVVVLNALAKPNTAAHNQIILYPPKSGVSKYTFSIWAFPEKDYPVLLGKYFEFCRNYYKETGFRCNMLNVGYRIKQDTNSWFPYSSEHPVMTLDPVSTGPLGWETFLTAFNDFCSEHHGVPLFNQTKWITRHQARKAFGVRLEQFEQERRGLDPKGRLLNEYFREKLS